MAAELACFNRRCGKHYPITEVIYTCPECGSLLEVVYDAWQLDPGHLKRVWRERRMDETPLNQSGVWRYRELIPFLEDYRYVVSLREGNTPLLRSRRAAAYAGLEEIWFKHQGFNPTGSFKDNGMTCGVAQALRLGMQRVGCVSTGNTSASMTAYAAAAGLQPVIFVPHGNIAFGKLAQALEYGAVTVQVRANFDQILALVRELAGRLGMYLLNSINPFRVEGQKTIAIELMDQRDWRVPDWVVLPGGNLGNTAALGKGFREMRAAGFIDRLPRLAVIQAEGAAPFWAFMQDPGEDKFRPVANPETLATAIRIGAPVSWPKAWYEVTESRGVVEKVTEEEIADAKAQIGRAGIGCEPASAATLAGVKKLVERGVIDRSAEVVAILTGNLLKDPDYVYRYHTGSLEAPSGRPVRGKFANRPVVVDNDPEEIVRLLQERA